MKTISILVPHQGLVAAIGNASYLFAMVNDFLEQDGKSPLYEVQLVGLSPEVRLGRGHFQVQADTLIQDGRKTDLIIIPPMSGDMERAVQLNRAFVPWIKARYEEGAEVASLCVGAFLLAETGLLQGRECSTHWNTSPLFRRLFPQVQLVDHKVITDNHGLYTSGGANSYWNLLIYLVRKHAGGEIARRASNYFEVELGRNSQSPFMTFEGYKLHEDEPVRKAQLFIEDNFQQSICLDQLAEQCHLSRRTLQRRFKSATHLTITDYIQRIRIEAAKTLLELRTLSVGEIMDKVGYHDPKAFRSVFRKVTDLTPQDYRGRYT